MDPEPTDTEPIGYPAEIEADVVLGDGGTAFVRPIRPQDGELLIAFHGRLSAESVYYRFFSVRPKLSAAEVFRFTNVDYFDRLALILLLGEDIIGVARYERTPGTNEAEVAFTVDDGHHERGIATLLLEHLASAARARGVTRFTAVTLPDNRGMGTVFRHAGFDAKAAFADGVVEFDLDLDPAPDALTHLQERIGKREHKAELLSIAPLLRPRSVAVIGASADPQSLGRAVVRNLVTNGFTGPIYPINRSGAAVSGVPAHTTMDDVSDAAVGIDLAILAVPANDVPDALAMCAAQHVKAAVVLAAGLDAEQARHLGEFARRHGMRLVGPASLGVLNLDPTVALHATFAGVAPEFGRVAVVVESGALGAALLERGVRVGLRFSTIVSLGAKVDVSANDLLHYWLDDDATSVVILYGEGFGNPRNFTRLARRFAGEKALVTIAADGDTDGRDDSLYRQLGVVRVRTVEELLDAARVIEAIPLPAGDRVTVITDSDNAGDTAVRSLRSLGFEIGESERVGFSGGAQDYGDAARRAAGRSDALVIVYSPAVGGNVGAVAEAVLGVTADRGIPIVVISNHGDPHSCPLPLFRFPESAAHALGHLAELARSRRRTPATEDAVAIDVEAAQALVDAAIASSPEGRPLRWDESVRLLATAGIRVADGRIVGSLTGALEAAAELGFPLAIKAMGLERMGRSEAGGVALDLHDAETLAAAYERMRDLLGDGMREALVQRMADGPGIECIVAVEPHDVFGPVISVGIGGIVADRLRQRPRRALPLTEQDAFDLVAEAPIAQVLHDRGLDVGSLVDIVRRMAALADAVHELTGLRCNPILVSSTGSAVLSARVAVRPTPTEHLPVRRL